MAGLMVQFAVVNVRMVLSKTMVFCIPPTVVPELTSDTVTTALLLVSGVASPTLTAGPDGTGVVGTAVGVVSTGVGVVGDGVTPPDEIVPFAPPHGVPDDEQSWWPVGSEVTMLLFVSVAGKPAALATVNVQVYKAPSGIELVFGAAVAAMMAVNALRFAPAPDGQPCGSGVAPHWWIALLKFLQGPTVVSDVQSAPPGLRPMAGLMVQFAVVNVRMVLSNTMVFCIPPTEPPLLVSDTVTTALPVLSGVALPTSTEGAAAAATPTQSALVVISEVRKVNRPLL